MTSLVFYSMSNRYVSTYMSHSRTRTDIKNANVRQEFSSCGTSSKRYKWF